MVHRVSIVVKGVADVDFTPGGTPILSVLGAPAGSPTFGPAPGMLVWETDGRLTTFLGEAFPGPPANFEGGLPPAWYKAAFATGPDGFSVGFTKRTLSISWDFKNETAPSVSDLLDSSQRELFAGRQELIVLQKAQKKGFADVSLDMGGGNDRLVSSGGDDKLLGGRGRDEISGGGGRDVIKGGAGDDHLRGDAHPGAQMQGKGAADKLYGQRGDDRLEGGVGRDWLVGGSGDDLLFGGAGKDILIGQGGADELRGGGGGDALISSLGRNDLWGGGGRDDFFMSDVSGTGRTVIHDFERGDRIGFDRGVYYETADEFRDFARETRQGVVFRTDTGKVILKDVDLDDIRDNQITAIDDGTIPFF